jgi:hypothetical protein
METHISGNGLPPSNSNELSKQITLKKSSAARSNSVQPFHLLYNEQDGNVSVVIINL